MTYVRPPLDVGEYLDEHGAVIPYGQRWGMGSPREDTYSVTRHPERFAPLLDVAQALREYLIATYDVTVEGDRLIPSDPAAAPLTITVTDFPLVRLRAGISGVEGAPQCGCDACDEDVEELAGELEGYVLGVAEGRFQESLAGKGVSVTWEQPGGNSISWTRITEKDERKALKARGRGAVYAPWPQRRAV